MACQRQVVFVPTHTASTSAAQLVSYSLIICDYHIRAWEGPRPLEGSTRGLSDFAPAPWPTDRLTAHEGLFVLALPPGETGDRATARTLPWLARLPCVLFAPMSEKPLVRRSPC